MELDPDWELAGEAIVEGEGPGEGLGGGSRAASSSSNSSCLRDKKSLRKSFK